MDCLVKDIIRITVGRVFEYELWFGLIKDRVLFGIHRDRGMGISITRICNVVGGWLR